VNRHSERGNLSAAADAALVKTAGTIEAAELKGYYKATMFGPVEERRSEFVRLRDRLFDLGYMEAVQRHVAGLGSVLHLVPDEIGREHFALWREFAAIPLEIKWLDDIRNVITTVGANEFEDKYLGGSAYTAAVVMGLKGTGTAVIADTQASHASWSEVGLANAPVYTGNRPTPSFSAASAKVKATSSAVNFAFTSGGTVAGCFLNQGGSSTKDNTTGTLFSAGDFTGGSKTVANGDQLNVSWQVTV
jgi:hypothetical protein